GSGSATMATLKFEPRTGARRWVQEYVNAGQEGGTSITVSPTGSRVVIAGVTGSQPLTYATIGYEPKDGTQDWVQIYAPASAASNTAGIVAAPDGSKVYTAARGADGQPVVAYKTTTGMPEHLGPVIGPNGAEVVVTGSAVGQS